MVDLELELEAIGLEYQGKAMNIVVDLFHLKRLYEDVQYYNVPGRFTNDPIYGYSFCFDEDE